MTEIEEWKEKYNKLEEEYSKLKDIQEDYSKLDTDYKNLMERSNQVISMHLDSERKQCNMFPHTSSALLEEWSNATGAPDSEHQDS